MILKRGQKVDLVVGAAPKTTLANTIDKHLKPDDPQKGSKS
ncbi:thioredoxin 1 [Microcystis aeruginosa NIES-2519]|uniref:Thioredoxin 1 n=1 Tax=Microcystis aeruginosa NIES-2519 TaxID=2303981 RepID=A0A5A5R2B7_MICAE|nr:thioredoxin 1 [Microcystis aeruginosa NIES-2519]GCA82638.1 thioredoxin 1 [Microcystis aeruginosa NIES-2522]